MNNLVAIRAGNAKNIMINLLCNINNKYKKRSNKSIRGH